MRFGQRLLASARRAFRNYLIAGVLVLAPLVITAYVLVSGFTLLDRVLADAVTAVIGIRVPGAGAVLTVAATMLVGMFATNVVGRRVIALWDRLFERIPVVRSVYSSVKQLMQALGAQNRSAFKQVVMVEHPRRDMWSIGFITNQCGEALQGALQRRSATVFVPTAPNPMTGFLVIVPEEDIIPLDLTVESAFKLIVSAGVVMPETPKEAASTEG